MKKTFVMVALLVLGYAYAYGWDKRAAIQAYIQQQQSAQSDLENQLRNMEWELMNMKKANEPPTPPAMVPGSAAERAAAVQRAKGVFFKDSYHGKKKNTRRVEDGY